MTDTDARSGLTERPEDEPAGSLPSAPSRRSLRGMPPVTTSSIPVVPAPGSGVPRPINLESADTLAGAANAPAEPDQTCVDPDAEPHVEATAPSWDQVVGNIVAAAQGSTEAGSDPVPNPDVVAAEQESAETTAVVADSDEVGEPADPAEDELTTSHRRRWWWIALVVILVGALGAIGAIYWSSREPVPAEVEVMQVPLPTATASPAQRAATTAFASILPATVLQYALVDSQEDLSWMSQGAIESYQESYSDGAAGELTVRVGQWATADQAQTHWQSLVDSTQWPELSRDVVMVSGEEVGSVVMSDPGDGTGVAIWRNGTAVVTLTAPIDEIQNAYAVFPF